jgi:hypothetical protein
MTTSEDPKSPAMEEISEELSKLKANEEPEVVYPLRVVYCGGIRLSIYELLKYRSFVFRVHFAD